MSYHESVGPTRKILAYGSRTLSSVVTPTRSSQGAAANPITAAVGKDCSSCTLNADDTSSASPAVPFLAAWRSHGPPALGPVQQELLSSPLLGAGHRGVLLPRSPRDVAAVPAHSRGDDACRWYVTLALTPGPMAGAPGERHGVRCEVHGSARPQQRGSAYLLLHALLSQRWRLSTPRRRGTPCPGNGWGNPRAWETIKFNRADKQANGHWSERYCSNISAAGASRQISIDSGGGTLLCSRLSPGDLARHLECSG